MFCPNCGANISDGAGFCTNCGAALKARRTPVSRPEPEAQPAPSRPILPWILLGCVALIALAVIVVLLVTGGKDASAPAPTADPGVVEPTADPGPIVVPPTGDPGLTPASPTPTSQIIVITPSPVPVTPASEVPDMVRVFYKDVEKTEFTAAVGESVPLNAQAYPIENFTNASFTWTVSDTSVLKLEPDAYGRTCTVTVLKKSSGPVTLTVTCCGKSANVIVYTKNAAPSVPPAGPVTLDKDTQYRINIFLSNFSEQSFLSMKLSTAPDDQLMKFVWLYCKINHSSTVGNEGAYETVSLATMNEYLNRFFGITRNPYNGASYMLDQWNSFEYHDGKFWFPAASGESYNKFTVVDKMTSNGDGTYTVEFQVYELSLEEYWNTPGVDNSYYWLNHDQVAAKVWDYHCKPVQGGTAVVRDFTYNSRATYQLISYEVWDIEFSY